MPDLRIKFNNPNYYKEIRSKRVTPAKGYIQTLSEEDKKALSAKGHSARWGKKNDSSECKLGKRTKL
jgi:hypothetical protein